MNINKLKGKVILIVEDDFSSRLYLNKILEKSEAKLLNATDGHEAYEMVVQNEDIDLILMDIQLPVIDGYSCTKMIRESGRKIIIIAQTAYGLTGDKEKMIDSGFDDYLIKPISQNQLFDKLNRFLK
jgi:two-component system cell cycle response regulator DivK